MVETDMVSTGYIFVTYAKIDIRETYMAGKRMVQGSQTG